jgi:short-subunit dehydrogenase
MAGTDSGPTFCAALVTGAAGGIGSALCPLLARDGTELILLDRDAEGLERLRSELGDRAQVATHVIDIRDFEALDRGTRGILDRHPQLDLVVANAGIDHPTSILSGDWRTVLDHFAVNVEANCVLLAAVLPWMAERGSGHVAAMVSLGGLGGFPYEAGYCASKAALAVLIESARAELGPKGVTFTSIFPGFVRTSMALNNAFRIPSMLEPADAAARIHRAIVRRQPTLHFPAATYVQILASKVLPVKVRDAIARRLMKQDFVSTAVAGR